MDLRWLPTLVALCVACGDDDGPNDAGVDDAGIDAPLDTDRDAGVDAGASYRGILSRFTECTSAPEGAECATLTVPLDWGDPNGPLRIELGVVRIRATGPDERIGVLLYNPGGPGEATVGSVPSIHSDNPEIAARFDYVGMDFRGVGTSMPAFACYDTELQARIRAAHRGGSTAADWDEMQEIAVRIAERCEAIPESRLFEHVSVFDAAKDMEALRDALEEEELHFVGYSAGTALGAAYATLFPERVGAFLLDSPTSMLDGLRHNVEQSVALEVGLDHFFEWCAAAESRCFFSRGRSADELRAAFDAMVLELRESPVATGSSAIDDGHLLNAALASTAVPTNYPRLAAQLGALETGAVLFSTSGFLPGAENENYSLGFFAITARDRPMPSWVTPARVQEIARTEVAPAAPRLGLHNMVNTLIDIAWPFRADTPVRYAAPDAPPMLIIAGRFDPRTPYQWGQAMRDALGNDSYFVSYEGDGHAMSSRDPCLRSLVVAHLLDPASPPATTSCEGVLP